MTVELETLLSPEMYTRLKDEANRRSTPMNVLIRDALESFIHDLDEADLGDLEDPSDEQVLAHIRAGMDDVKAGRVRPAHEALADLRRRFGDDAKRGRFQRLL